jgi:small subunit ribosomal protein S4
VEVNGHVVDVPSYHVRPGDEVALRAGHKDLEIVAVSLEARTRPNLPEWLALDQKARVGRVVRQPERQDIPLAVQEQLIVELYSK